MVPEDLHPPDRRERLLRWAITALLVLGFGACLSEGADSPDDPQLPRASFPGFGEVAIRIQTPQANPTDVQVRCALLASTDEQRSRGLMEVTDLRGYVGMVFRYSGDSTGGYIMRNTPMPLSIAWFAADGTFVSGADMAPCPEAEQNCPVYSATGPYRYALEVPQGQFAPLGIGPGSKLVLTSSTCPDED